MGRYYLSFDDTDNLESPGTGHLLQDFLDGLSLQASFISRHQLFVSREVPYTSHNSAMCAVVTGDLSGDTLIADAGAFLRRRLAQGADPGLCVAEEGRILCPEQLVLWGYRAKKEVLTKADAYALAARCGVHLSEHGGTGQGVVGALAAVGLRLAGQDGRVKGKQKASSQVMTAQALLRETGFQRVCALGQGELPGDAVIHIDDQPVKAVFQNFSSTVLVVPEAGAYRLLPKEALKCF